MSIEMIDPEIARFAKSFLTEGGQANFVTGPDKRTFSFEVVSIKDYSVIVKSAIGSLLELPISKNEVYIQEISKVRMTMPEQTPADKPTRRRRTKAEIEAENNARLAEKNAAKQGVQPVPPQQPAFEYQPPPGPANFDSWSPPPVTPPQPAVYEAPAGTWQAETQPHPALEGVRVPVDAPLEADGDWIEKAVQEAGQTFLNEITGIIKTIYSEQPLQEPAKTVVKTCFDCVMINLRENKCDKFNVTPPLNIIKMAQTQCEGFFPDDQIPF